MLGDFYKKPTQFWFINCLPKNNLRFGYDIKVQNEIRKVNDVRNQVKRSLISEEFAKTFVDYYIVDEERSL